MSTAERKPKLSFSATDYTNNDTQFFIPNITIWVSEDEFSDNNENILAEVWSTLHETLHTVIQRFKTARSRCAQLKLIIKTYF